MVLGKTPAYLWTGRHYSLFIIILTGYEITEQLYQRSLDRQP